MVTRLLQSMNTYINDNHFNKEITNTWLPRPSPRLLRDLTYG